MVLRFLVLAVLVGFGIGGCASKEKFVSAVESGNLEEVRKNVKEEWVNNYFTFGGGAYPPRRSRPLFLAMENGKWEIAKLLIEKGADVNSITIDGDTPLRFAIRNSNTEIAKLLIEKGADVNSKNENGWTPLHYASNLEIAKLLIEKGADVNSKNKNGWTPLHSVSSNGKWDVAKLLIEKGAYLNYKDNDGNTPLLSASEYGKWDVAKLLIEKGAYLNLKNNYGNTPLHKASQYGKWYIAKLLIEKGADVNSKNKDGDTPLHFAIRNSNTEMAKLLIEKGAYLNSKDNDGNTPLLFASDYGKWDVAKLLIEKGADVNSKNKNGWTPLHSASGNGNLEIAKLLIEKGANVNSKTKDGWTPLLSASYRGKWDIAKFLIEKDVDVNSKTKDGWTPLHSASYNRKLEIAKLLIEKGANVNSKNKDGDTPLHSLFENERYRNRNNTDKNKNLDMVKYLIEKGADVNSKNKDGDTPLHSASKGDVYGGSYGTLEMVKLLIKKGANPNIENSKLQKPVNLAKNNSPIFNYLLSVKYSVIPQNIAEKYPPKLTLALSSKSERAIKRVQQKQKSQNILSSSTIQLSGSVVDDSKIVEAKVNETPISLNFQGEFQISLPIKNGSNTFTLFAKDKFGNSATKTLSLDNVVIKENNIQNWYKNQYALVVGIDRYKNGDIPTLNNAVNDAKKLSEILEIQGFAVTSLYNEKATKREIFKSIRDIASKTGKNDNFLLYFAGHGQGLKLKSGDRVGYLIPFDSEIDLESQNVFDFDEEAIALTQIQKYAKDMPSNHVALLLDSCFSGLAMNDNRVLKNLIEMNSEYYNDILSRKAINILTAGDDQPVSDGSGHSPFATAIIEGMEKRGLDINDRDGFATFTELATYVKTKVEKATNREQRPQFDNLSAEDGDFIFKLR